MTDSLSRGTAAPAIVAIGTRYKGCNFRSRLEARWAVFFDSLGIEWTYETEGYELTRGGERMRYLPDFCLPNHKMLVEVKGGEASLQDDARRIVTFVKNNALPNLTGDGGLIILGDIPPQRFGVWMHPCLRHEPPYPGYEADGGVAVMTWIAFAGSVIKAIPEGDSWINSIAAVPPRKHFARGEDLRCTAQFIGPRGWKKTLDAYDAARSMRFESGARRCADCGRNSRADGSDLETQRALRVGRYVCLSCYFKIEEAAQSADADRANGFT